MVNLRFETFKFCLFSVSIQFTNHPAMHSERTFNSSQGSKSDLSGASRRDVLKIGSLGLLAPSLLAGCWDSTSVNYEATIADARTAIIQALSDSNTPSISVALIDRERVIWSEAFGVINKSTKAAPTTDTLFSIGSCSKVIAAMAVMILVDRKMLSLDDPLVRYVPGFSMASADYTKVTVRMLISHASGFAGSDNRNQGTWGRPYPGYAAQVMETLSKSRLKHLPGEMSVYCNDGFTMVEPLIEAVTGKTYVQFVSDEILNPLGMTHSRFALEPFQQGSYAPGYVGDFELQQEFMNAYATGGLCSTPSDMARLAMMLLNAGQFQGRRILQPASVLEMARNQTVTETIRPVVMADGFGLGWDGVREGGLAEVGVTAWHKNGGTNIYGSELFVLPDEGLALFITGTSRTYGPIALAERIVLNALVEKGRIAAFPPPLTAPSTKSIAASDLQLAEMTGFYANYTGLARIESSGGVLVLSTYANGAWIYETSLQLRSDGSFSSDKDLLTSYRSVSAQGERYLIKRCAGAVVGQGLKHHQDEFPYMQKVNPGGALMPAWTSRVNLQALAVNYPADSPIMQEPMGVLLQAAPGELTGYVLNYNGQILNASTNSAAALMCLKIPYIYGRDLCDFVIVPQAGEEFVRLGSDMYRPLSNVPVLTTAATNTVTIGAESYAEWRHLTSSAMLSIQGSADWKLYDGNFRILATGTGIMSGLLAPADAYLVIFGEANTSVTTSLS